MPPRPEASLYALIASGTLGPVVAHTLWRPLTGALAVDPAGTAYAVAIAAAAVGILAALIARHADRRANLAVGGFAFALGLFIGGLPAALALLAAAVAALWAAPRVARDFPPSLTWTGRRRAFALAVGALIGLVALVGTARLAAFMGDVAYMRFAQPPDIEFYHSHFCMTAYAHAAELVRAGVADVYDLRYGGSGVNAADLPTAAFMAPFDLDRFGYPPQFIAVPLALSAVLPDFAAQRAVWFGLSGLLFAWTLWRASIWVGPRGGRLAVLALPVMWIAVLPTLQTGNAHIIVLSVAVLGMQAIADRRESLGGGLLAAATLAKIAPGLLGVVLLVQRRWRATGWTIAWAVILSAIALAAVGWGPFDAFLHGHLPRIASGEAYDFLDDSLLDIVSNGSPFSLPFKLAALGVDLDPWRWGPRAGAAFTALAFALAIIGGLRGGDRRAQLGVWLAILTLAALRSPMAPPYVGITAFWALLLIAAEDRGPGRWVARIGAAALLGWPLALLAAGSPERYGPGVITGSMIAIGVVIGLMGWVLVRRWPSLGDDARA